jgi:hypothetical protein
MHTPEPAPLGISLVGGISPAWGAMEALNRAFSAEWTPHGVRAICLRTTGMEETPQIDVVYGQHARAYGITVQEFATTVAANSHRKRATTLNEPAPAAWSNLHCVPPDFLYAKTTIRTTSAAFRLRRQQDR